MELSGPHRPRPIRFLGLHREGGWRVKLYGIAATGELPRKELVAATLEAIGPTLPGSHESGHGVAFAIAHDAADHCFVLVDWFSRENEIHQRMLWAPRARPAELSAHPGPAIGCVWELAVTDFERRAWLTFVLANPAGPDLDAYLSAHLEKDV